MEIGIDDINRAIITTGHKAIISPRDFDFVDFPTTATEGPAVGTIQHYKHWDVYKTYAYSGTYAYKYKKTNDKQLYIEKSSIRTNSTDDIFFRTNRNIKGALLGISMFVDCETHQDVWDTIDLNIVKPDGTILLNLSHLYVTETQDYMTAQSSVFLWWEGDVLYAERLETIYMTQTTYTKNNLVFTPQTITDPDVRLILYSKASGSTYADSGFIKITFNSVSLG